jgi:hypothetical protein
VHFSFPAGQGRQLWDGGEASLAFVDELEDQWETYYLRQTDKAWDPIHRCLADGTGRWPGPAATGHSTARSWWRTDVTRQRGRPMVFTADQ